MGTSGTIKNHPAVIFHYCANRFVWWHHRTSQVSALSLTGCFSMLSLKQENHFSTQILHAKWCHFHTLYDIEQEEYECIPMLKQHTLKFRTPLLMSHKSQECNSFLGYISGSIFETVWQIFMIFSGMQDQVRTDIQVITFHTCMSYFSFYSSKCKISHFYWNGPSMSCCLPACNRTSRMFTGCNSAVCQIL